MKKTNLAEKIGFVIIILGVIFMVLNDKVENNPIQFITKEYLLFNSGGLLIWALGYMKRESDQKKNKNGQNPN